MVKKDSKEDEGDIEVGEDKGHRKEEIGKQTEIDKQAEVQQQAKGCPLVATTFKIEFLKSCIPTIILLIAITLLMSAFDFRPIVFI